MKQLSGLDASFLQLERGNTMLHGAALAIYDPSTAPGGFVRYKDILRFFTSWIMQFPQFRRRLVTVPFALDRPYWIEEPDIDVEFHVRHIALPRPGELMDIFTLFAFAVAYFIALIVPGPGVAAIVARALGGGTLAPRKGEAAKGEAAEA